MFEKSGKSKVSKYFKGNNNALYFSQGLYTILTYNKQNNLTVFALTKNATLGLNVYISANTIQEGLRHVLKLKLTLLRETNVRREHCFAAPGIKKIFVQCFRKCNGH